MSGVKTGTRLERLYILQRQVKQEIEILEREAALATRAAAKPEPVKRPRRPAKESSVQLRLSELGVSAYDVKEWAFSAGLIEEIRRGRVGSVLVDAYALAHPIEGAS